MKPTARILEWLHPFMLAASDIAATYLAFRLAAKLQRIRDTRMAPEGNLPSTAFLLQIGAVALCVVVAFILFKLYIRRRGFSRIDLLFVLVQAVLVGFGGALAASSLLGFDLSHTTFTTVIGDQSRTIPAELWRSTLVWWAVFTLGLIWLGRVALDSCLRLLRRRGFDQANVLIVGTGDLGRTVLEKIRHAPELGYRVLGFIDDRPADDYLDGVSVLGRRADVERLIPEYQISEIILAAPELSLHDRLELVTGVARRQVNIRIVPDIMEIMSSEVTTSDLTGLPMMQVRDVALRGWNLTIKRALDIGISSLTLVVLSPVLILLALLVKLTSGGGSAFYVQERVGLDGKPFQLVKFRSMRVDAESHTGPIWAHENDPRRTRLGRLMRRFSLDELPQLVNVLAGEMSLVGPRPERPHFVRQFRQRIPRYDHRHHEKAGLTGHAQVHGLRGNTSIEERTTYDVYYVENWSLLFDIKILFKTIGAVFRDKNAY